MSEEIFRVGDVVEGKDFGAREFIQKHGNIVVSISEDGEYLRFKGQPFNGYRARCFKKIIVSLENI